jgi:hypothetical protein
MPIVTLYSLDLHLTSRNAAELSCAIDTLYSTKGKATKSAQLKKQYASALETSKPPIRNTLQRECAASWFHKITNTTSGSTGSSVDSLISAAKELGVPFEKKVKGEVYDRKKLELSILLKPGLYVISCLIR